MGKSVDARTEKSVTTSPKRVLSEDARAELRDLIEDVYLLNKWKIVRMNFLRGVAFGLGTFIGGTIVVALIVWFLSQTIDLFPSIRDFSERLIESLQK